MATADRKAPVLHPQPMAATSTILSERDAIIAGVHAADAALAGLKRFDVLQLFVRTEQSPSGEPKLVALCAYAELRRALLPQGRTVPATSLSAVGFTAEQITQFDMAIASTALTDPKTK